MSAASRRELKWWRDNLGTWKLRTALGGLARGGVKELFVDASGYAYGATNAVWGMWNEEEVRLEHCIKEIEALRRAVTKLPRWIEVESVDRQQGGLLVHDERKGILLGSQQCH